MTDTPSLNRLMSTIRPDEVYNLAAQSHVGISFNTPEYTGQADAMGPLRILEAIKSMGLLDTCRFYQASTSELYGKVKETPQNETTPFHPRSPYAVAKLYAHWITINYREAFGLYALNGIMFNHESPRRGENFVTRKITLSLANILAGEQKKLSLGNLNSKARLGLRQGLCRRHVAGIATGGSGGLCVRNGNPEKHPRFRNGGVWHLRFRY